MKIYLYTTHIVLRPFKTNMKKLEVINPNDDKQIM